MLKRAFRNFVRITRWSTEAFFLWPSRPLSDYLISLHLFPITATFVLSVVLCLNGSSPFWSIVLTISGIVVSGVVFFLSPLPLLRPIGGRHSVGLVHMDGRRSQQMPPLAVFYPTNIMPGRRGVPYVPFDDERFLRGVAAYAHMPFFLMKDFSFVRISASLGAVPAPVLAQHDVPPPVIVFSHGLAGYHRLYSCFALDLAARGAIVVAVGHCDNSASFMRDSGGEVNEVPLKDLGWQVPARETQVKQRISEVRGTLRRLTESDFWRTIGHNDADISTFLSKPLQVHLVGHSFGGATMLATALEEHQRPVERVSVRSVYAFDPWMLPIQNEHFYTPLRDGRKLYTIPTVLMHSDDWVRDTETWEFFKRVKSLVYGQSAYALLSEAQKEARFRSVIAHNTNHISLVDASVLSPIIHGNFWSSVSPRVQIMEWCNAVLRFAKENVEVPKTC